MPDIIPIDLSQADHAAALLALLDHYARDPMGGGSGLSEQARANLVTGLQARSDYFGFFAFENGEALGLINCFEGFSTFAAKPLMNVHDIAVLRQHRGRGLSRLLLGAAEDLARQRGCCKLTLEVLSGNRVAMSAYKSFGFAPYVLDPGAGDAVFLQKIIAPRS